MRSASDRKAVDTDNFDKDEKQDNIFDKSINEYQGCARSQDRLRRCGRAWRPTFAYWRPKSLAAHEEPMAYLKVVQGRRAAERQVVMDEEMNAIRKSKNWGFTYRPGPLDAGSKANGTSRSRTTWKKTGATRRGTRRTLHSLVTNIGGGAISARRSRLWPSSLPSVPFWR